MLPFPISLLLKFVVNKTDGYSLNPFASNNCECITAGYFVDNIPSWLDWLQAFSFIRYPYSLIMSLQYPAGQSASCRNDGDAQENCESRDFVPGDVNERKKWEDAVALAAFLLFARIAVYYFLKLRLRGT